MPWEFFDRSAHEVESNIELMNGRADAALSTALSIVAQLGAVRFDDTDVSVPSFTLAPVDIPPLIPPKAPSPLTPAIIGTVNIPTFDNMADQLGLTLSDLDITIPDFVNPIGPLSIPSSTK